MQQLRDRPAKHLRRLPRREDFPRPLKRCLEAPRVEGLQQVIHRVDVEGAQRVLVVGRGEDHRARSLRAELRQRGEAIHLRHLHIEEKEIRREAAHRFHRRAAIGAAGHHLHVRRIRQQRVQPAARQLLVGGDDGADQHGREAASAGSGAGPEADRGTGVSVSCARRAGSEITALEPPVSGRSVSETSWVPAP